MARGRRDRSPNCAGCELRTVQGFAEDLPVARSEGDATEGGERRSDVRRGNGLKIFAGLDAIAHQQNGHMLIVTVGRVVAGAGRAWFSRRRTIQQPVGFGHDEKVATAPRKIAKSQGPEHWALRGGATF